jgi:phage portal protein BeeE
MGKIRDGLSSLFPLTFGKGGAPTGAAAASPPPEVRSFPLVHADFIPLDGSGSTIDVEAHALLRDFGYYATSVLCYAAMRYRAEKIAEAPLYVAQESEEGWEWLKAHPLAPLLSYPNEDEEMADLLEAVSLSLDSTGMALFLMDNDRAGRPGRINLFRGDEFTVRPAGDRLYGEFSVSTSMGAARGGTETVGPERVVFFRNPHPTDRWRGLAPMDVVGRHLGIERQLLRAMTHAIPNAVVPGLTVTYPAGTTLTTTQQQELGAQLAIA